MWEGPTLFNRYTFYRPRLSVRATGASPSCVKHRRCRVNHDMMHVDHSTDTLFHRRKNVSRTFPGTSFHSCDFKIPFDFQTFSLFHFESAIRCSETTTQPCTSALGGWSLLWEISAPHANWSPTDYYGCLLIGWWSADWLIAWKLELSEPVEADDIRWRMLDDAPAGDTWQKIIDQRQKNIKASTKFIRSLTMK